MMQWHNTLEAPRSLLTGADISLSVIEDPGFLALYGSLSSESPLVHGLINAGISLPEGNNLDLAFFEGGFTVGRKQNTLWIFSERMESDRLYQTLHKTAQEGSTVLIRQRTGHFAALRLMGTAAAEILAKVCSLPVDFKHVSHAFSFTFLHGETLVIPERMGKTFCWQLLVPRSEADALAERLISAAMLQPRIGL